MSDAMRCVVYEVVDYYDGYASRDGKFYLTNDDAQSATKGHAYLMVETVHCIRMDGKHYRLNGPLPLNIVELP